MEMVASNWWMGHMAGQSAETVPTILSYKSAAVARSRSLPKIRQSVTEQSSVRLDGEFAGQLCRGTECSRRIFRRSSIFELIALLYILIRQLVCRYSRLILLHSSTSKRRCRLFRRSSIFELITLLYNLIRRLVCRYSRLTLLHSSTSKRRWRLFRRSSIFELIALLYILIRRLVCRCSRLTLLNLWLTLLHYWISRSSIS